MKTSAFAGRRIFLASLVSLVAGGSIVFCSSSALPAEDATAALSSPGVTDVAYLDYCIAPRPLITWALHFNSEPKAFQKEPATEGRKVCRASLRLRESSDEATAFLWDYTKGKLYLDLNHNRDLTDDPEGVLRAPVSRFSYFYQSFTNAPLKVKTPRGSYPVCVDLNLYSPESMPSGTVALRSFWGGKMTLRGRECQVGRADAGSWQFGLDNQGYLLLRPWDQREEPWDLMNGSLAAFTFSPNLFFDGQSYRVDCAFIQQGEVPRFKLSFRGKEAELGELRLTGEFIERLVLSEGGESADRRPNRQQTTPTSSAFTVVLDRPESVVKMPVGAYRKWQVAVKSEGIAAHSQPRYGGSQPTIEVLKDASSPALLAAGGPLTNSVSVHAQGRYLALNYQLLGRGGAYELTGQDRSHPPKFVVYRKGKEIHSGQFEFG